MKEKYDLGDNFPDYIDAGKDIYKHLYPKFENAGKYSLSLICALIPVWHAAGRDVDDLIELIEQLFTDYDEAMERSKGKDN